MIEEIADLPEGTLGFKMSGAVTGDDYDSVLTPAIDKAIENLADYMYADLAKTEVENIITNEIEQGL